MKLVWLLIFSLYLILPSTWARIRKKRNFNYQFGGYDENEYNQIKSNNPSSSSSSYSLFNHYQINRPCPKNCNCNFDTINCNDLVESCTECVHWSKIDFNQIIQMKSQAFKNYMFSSNHSTHIIIYKLLNSTLGAFTLDKLHLSKNSHVEITFQYNSMIKFDENALKGLQIDSNATLVFNFPYTTQVIFMPKCFDGIKMGDSNSRLIIRVLKSFSVRFMGDFAYYLQKEYNLSPPKPNQSLLKPNEWSLSTGKLIIDIKSTHLVKFDEFSFSNLNMLSNAQLFIDLDLVEKLMLQRYSLASMTLKSSSRLVVYAKQITFIDFKAFSLSGITLDGQSQMEVYLEELTSSLCLQRNVFSNMKLQQASKFNFSVINSKNVQLMHHAFSDLRIENANAKFHLGVYQSPSFLLLFQNDLYYKSFLNQRAKYLQNMQQHPHHHYLSLAAYSSSSNGDYFYGGGGVGFDTASSYSKNEQNKKISLKSFYKTNKNLNSYNFSVEKDCFKNFTSTTPNLNQVLLVADNIHTFLMDNEVFSSSTTNLFLNFILNVKHFVLSVQSLSTVKNIHLNFIKEPRVFKLGLENENYSFSAQRLIKISGLENLQIDNNNNDNNPVNNRKLHNNDYDNSPIDSRALLKIQSSFVAEDLCQLKSIPKSHTMILFEDYSSSDKEECSSCQVIQLVYNQLKDLKSLYEVRNSKILPCKLKDLSFLENCMSELETKCSKLSQNEEKILKKNSYVKFWEYCISESDPSALPQSFKLADLYDNSLNRKKLNDIESYFNMDRQNMHESSNQLKPSFFDLIPSDMSPHSFSSSSMGNYDDSDSNTDDENNSNMNKNNGINDNDDNGLTSNRNLGKIVGIAVICFICAIILFMITVNIIQYKFRNDLFDDFECSSQNIAVGNPNGSTPNGKRSKTDRNDIKSRECNRNVESISMNRNEDDDDNNRDEDYQEYNQNGVDYTEENEYQGNSFSHDFLMLSIFSHSYPHSTYF
jgi:hypothetical protein